MCVLHVHSNTMSFIEFLEKTGLPVYKSHEKGDRRRHVRQRRSPHEDYGFSCDVSGREWTDLSGQIEDAHLFLRQHESELRELKSTNVIDDIRLDFPYSCHLDEGIVTQSKYLPPDFLRLAGELGIGIELSHYPPSADEASADGQ